MPSTHFLVGLGHATGSTGPYQLPGHTIPSSIYLSAIIRPLARSLARSVVASDTSKKCRNPRIKSLTALALARSLALGGKSGLRAGAGGRAAEKKATLVTFLRLIFSDHLGAAAAAAAAATVSSVRPSVRRPQCA